MSKRETKDKIKQGIQNQLHAINAPVVSCDSTERVAENTIDREIEALRNILMSISTLKDDEKKRVFHYLKNRYASSWPGENY